LKREPPEDAVSGVDAGVAETLELPEDADEDENKDDPIKPKPPDPDVAASANPPEDVPLGIDPELELNAKLKPVEGTTFGEDAVADVNNDPEVDAKLKPPEDVAVVDENSEPDARDVVADGNRAPDVAKNEAPVGAAKLKPPVEAGDGVKLKPPCVCSVLGFERNISARACFSASLFFTLSS